MALPEAIVEPFIVGVVEALLLERPFQVPVDLGHEEEAGNTFAHPLGRRRPEERRTLAPGSFEDLGQDQHGHVAAHAVALSGNPHQFADHRFLRGGVGVVELQCVGPAGEIGITAVGEDQIAPLAFDSGIVLRSAGQVEFGALNEIVGMIFDPGMIEPHVIGHEVEHELQAALAEPLAQAGQSSVTPEILMDRVAGDREAGAGDVFLAQIRERLLELAAPLGIVPRDLLRTRARSARR